jgi:membrane protein insertase Oxa1/YidC/SpoIIIJ
MLLQQWFTQRRTPSAGGAQIMGWIFPLIMALMFLSFPAALWLYWLFTTLLQIGQQWFVEQELARAGPRGVRKPDESPGD